MESIDFILMCNQVSVICLMKLQSAEIFLPAGGRSKWLSQKEAATYMYT